MTTASIQPPKPLYIAIEGPIGVGKTTLTNRLAERLNARLVLEIVEDNPFLADFYTDRGRYAFQTQIFFLMSRFKQQDQLQQPDLFRPNVVADYHLLKDRLFARLNLRDEELALYEAVYRALEAQILKPDVIIYLHARQNVLLDRIALRGRPFEADFDRDYLMALSEVYRDFFRTFDTVPVLSLDTSELDLLNRPEAVDEVLQSVFAMAKQPKAPPGRSQ